MAIYLSSKDLKLKLEAAGFSLVMNRKEGTPWGTKRNPRQIRWIQINVPAERMVTETFAKRVIERAERKVIREIESIVGKLDICEAEMFHTDDDCNAVKGWIVAYIDTLD
jgi:hypothetical protein